MFSIKNHRLHLNNDPVNYKLTPNRSGNITPNYLVMHYTAGGSYSGAINWLTNSTAEASAHLVIGYDGSVTQLAPFNAKTWHAGVSFWKGISGLNSHSIGIELVNKGYAVNASDGAIVAKHKNGGSKRRWQVYPEEQFQVALEIAAALREKYDLKEVIGHDDISPGRKVDPGPAFDMNRFRETMFGNADDASDETDPQPTDIATVNTGDPDDTLNMRAWPSLQSLIIDKVPNGVNVILLRKNPGSHANWSEIFYNNQKGWVATRYLEG